MKSKGLSLLVKQAIIWVKKQNSPIREIAETLDVDGELKHWGAEEQQKEKQLR